MIKKKKKKGKGKEMSIVLAGFVLSFEPISRQEKAFALSSSRGGKTWKTVELVREGKLSGREKIFPSFGNVVHSC